MAGPAFMTGTAARVARAVVFAATGAAETGRGFATATGLDGAASLDGAAGFFTTGFLPAAFFTAGWPMAGSTGAAPIAFAVGRPFGDAVFAETSLMVLASGVLEGIAGATGAAALGATGAALGAPGPSVAAA